MHVLAEADQLDRLVREAHAALDRVREVQQAGRSSKMAMSTTCASKTSRILSPTSVVDRLQIELAGERLLDAVDQRELGVALPGLLDGPRSREGSADVLADEGEQLHVLIGVVNVGRVRLHDEDADRAGVCGFERDAQPVRGEFADHVELAQFDHSSALAPESCCG